MAARAAVKGRAARAAVNEDTYTIMDTSAVAKALATRAAVNGLYGLEIVEAPCPHALMFIFSFFPFFSNQIRVLLGLMRKGRDFQ